MDTIRDKWATAMFLLLIMAVGAATGFFAAGKMDAGQWTLFVEVMVGLGLSASLGGKLVGSVVEVRAAEAHAKTENTKMQRELADRQWQLAKDTSGTLIAGDSARQG